MEYLSFQTKSFIYFQKILFLFILNNWKKKERKREKKRKKQCNSSEYLLNEAKLLGRIFFTSKKAKKISNLPLRKFIRSSSIVISFRQKNEQTEHRRKEKNRQRTNFSRDREAYTNTEKNYLPRPYLPLFPGSEWKKWMEVTLVPASNNFLNVS